MRRVMAQVERVAASETRICILGETGTGKELVAGARCHERSPRQGARSYAELRRGFGGADRNRIIRPRKRSFTAPPAAISASSSRRSTDTIFLDEIGDMPLTMQAKLLRVLEKSEVERIGGERAINCRCAAS